MTDFKVEVLANVTVRVMQINIASLLLFTTTALTVRTVATDVTVCWNRIQVNAEWAMVSIGILIARNWAAILRRIEFARIKGAYWVVCVYFANVNAVIIVRGKMTCVDTFWVKLIRNELTNHTAGIIQVKFTNVYTQA
jgi:hypothetical protein